MPDRRAEPPPFAELLARDPAAGIAAALDALAAEPRLKPSAGLVLDPHGDVLRRWRIRVAAAVALLECPAAATVFAEVRDELADDPELAQDVLSAAVVTAALSADQRAALRALGAPRRQGA